MANKLKMAHERQKLQLRANILNGRARIASEQEKVKRSRETLSTMTQNTGSRRSATVPFVKISGVK